jgi:hypothetical protein
MTGIEVDNDVVRADLSDVIRGIRPRIAEIRIVTVNWFDAKLNSFSFGVRMELSKGVRDRLFFLYGGCSSRE